ncbi:unnamed protein product [Closterium sp. NIES-65]|nr:unnamed protein product [Closterium sp. NIES-65]
MVIRLRVKNSLSPPICFVFPSPWPSPLCRSEEEEFQPPCYNVQSSHTLHALCTAPQQAQGEKVQRRGGTPNRKGKNLQPPLPTCTALAPSSPFFQSSALPVFPLPVSVADQRKKKNPQPPASNVQSSRTILALLPILSLARVSPACLCRRSEEEEESPAPLFQRAELLHHPRPPLCATSGTGREGAGERRNGARARRTWRHLDFGNDLTALTADGRRGRSAARTLGFRGSCIRLPAVHRQMLRRLLRRMMFRGEVEQAVGVLAALMDADKDAEVTRRAVDEPIWLESQQALVLLRELWRKGFSSRGSGSGAASGGGGGSSSSSSERRRAERRRLVVFMRVIALKQEDDVSGDGREE